MTKLNDDGMPNFNDFDGRVLTKKEHEFLINRFVELEWRDGVSDTTRCLCCDSGSTKKNLECKTLNSKNYNERVYQISCKDCGTAAPFSPCLETAVKNWITLERFYTNKRELLAK